MKIPREGKFLLVVLVLVIASAIRGFWDSGSLVIEESFADPPPAQDVATRRWIEGVFAPLWSLQQEHGLAPGKLFDIELDESGNVYLLDMGKQIIRRYDDSGRETGLFSASPDLVPLDFDVAQDGKVLVSFQRSDLIAVFDAAGEMVRLVKAPFLVHRLTAVGQNIIVLSAEPGTSLLYKLTPEGVAASGFGTLVKAEVQHPLLADGWLAAQGADKVAYAGLRTGVLGVFSSSGSRLRWRESVNGSRIPALLDNKKGRTRIDPSSPLLLIDLTVSDDRIYVLTEESSNRVLDLYTLDLEYRASVRLPKKFHHVAISWPVLYGVDYSSLSAYRFTDTRGEADSGS